jgi:hypothetical protein
MSSYRFTKSRAARHHRGRLGGTTSANAKQFLGHRQTDRSCDAQTHASPSARFAMDRRPQRRHCMNIAILKFMLDDVD